MNDIIILVKRDKLMPYGDHRIQRTNAGLAQCWTKTKLHDRDRDWQVETVGITGLTKNFSRDRGIEEPYWEPS